MENALVRKIPDAMRRFVGILNQWSNVTKVYRTCTRPIPIAQQYGMVPFYFGFVPTQLELARKGKGRRKERKRERGGCQEGEGGGRKAKREIEGFWATFPSVTRKQGWNPYFVRERERERRGWEGGERDKGLSSPLSFSHMKTRVKPRFC